MKRFFSIVLLLITLFLLTGCVRIRATITMKSNGKADVSIKYLMSKSMQALSESDSVLDNETIENYRANGYTCTPFTEDDYDGYIISKNDFDITKGILNNEASLKEDGSKFILDIPWDSDNENSSASSLDAASAFISSQGGYAEIVVVLPVKPITHNATYVSKDGKTLTWNLLAMGDKTSVHVEYSAGSIVMLWIIRVVVGVVILAVCIVILIIILKLIKKRKQKAVNPAQSDEDELIRYRHLLQEKLITQDEYDKKRSEILKLDFENHSPESCNGENDESKTETGQ